MEYMSNRTIRVKFKKEAISKLMQIEIEDIESTVITVKESKNLYKQLNQDDIIEDWDFDFVEETPETEAIIPHEDKVKIEERLNDVELIAKVCQEEMDVNNYNNLATLIEAIILTCQKSPNLIFNEFLFKNQVKDNYSVVAMEKITTEHALCKMILESYYYHNITNFTENLINVIENIKSMWVNKSLKNYQTLTSLTYKLFKRE